MGMRRIAPLPLPGVTASADLGKRPELKWVAPTDLSVDDTYQRDLSGKSIRLIRNIAAEFAWNRMKLPITVMVKGALHVVDGQHTAIAAASIGLEAIPVLVVEAATLDERARSFVGHNTNRISVTSLDIYQALLASGDEDAVEVDAVCKKAKIRIRHITPSSAISEGDTASVASIRGLVKKRGVMWARHVLETLVSARLAPITQTHILAADYIICEAARGTDLVRLARVIRTVGEDGVLQAISKAKIERRPQWRVLAEVWMKRFKAEAA